MRPTISKLSEEMINLISAGEVVERPMSVVKELVENAIDAGSSSIEVELTEGGIKKIRVIDNGIGMKKDEILLALAPHSTSKIKSQDDLFNISTLGFRGEALPSILSVSNFNIQSRVEEETYGFYYHYEAGKLVDSGTVPMNVGTIIDVDDLFCNTPARFKHLSSVYTENAYITDYLYKCALAHPDISFKLTNNKKVLFDSKNAADLLEIIARTYGADVAKNMISFKNKNNLYTISGYTSNNQVLRSNKNAITILVNNRVIKNQSLVYAITDAYKSIIPIGKYPVTVLKINCSPLVIDVNVHPSKSEIRFTDEYLLKQLITTTIMNVLEQTDLIYENVLTKEVEDFDLFTYKNEPNVIEKVKSLNEETDLDWDSFLDSSELEEETNEEIVEKLVETKEVTYKEQTIQNNKRFIFSDLSYIGQFHKTYLLFEYLDELYLIDQHAAAERINYEKIVASFSNPELNEVTTELLVPVILSFSNYETAKIEENLSEFNKLGIDIEYFGGTSFKISKIPLWIIPGTEVEVLTEIILKIVNNSTVSKLTLYDELAKSISCKKSMKANMYILKEEVNSLLTNLDKCRMPFTCPHGRPTLIKFTVYELEKLFKRVI